MTYASTDLKIVENSFSRIIKRSKENDFMIVTAFRGELTRKENRARNTEMLKTLFNPKKLGGMLLQGKFTELNANTGEKKLVTEESFFITRNENISQEEFKKLAQTVIKKYDQEAVFIKIGDEVGYLQEGNNLLKFKGNTKVDVLSTKDIENGWSEFGKNKFVFEGHGTPSGLAQCYLFKHYGIDWLTSSITKDDMKKFGF